MQALTSMTPQGSLHMPQLESHTEKRTAVLPNDVTLYDVIAHVARMQELVR